MLVVTVAANNEAILMVTFKSKAGRDVNYHTNVGMQLLQLMGRDDKLPSAMYADDVPEALANLEQQLLKLAESEAPETGQRAAHQLQNEDDDKPAPISLKVRAEPLLELLQQAQAANTGLMWE
jgi:hypothetical protein